MPRIECYGACWVRFRVADNAAYEYTANHPDTVKAILGLFKISPWKALNLAKKQCTLTAIDRSTKLAKWREQTALYRHKETLELPPDTLPIKFAYELFRQGKRFTYHRGKFFVCEITMPKELENVV